MSFLGIDLGTSGLRALLTDDAGKTVHCAEVAYETATPKPGWSEQDPQLWSWKIIQFHDQLRLQARTPYELRQVDTDYSNK